MLAAIPPDDARQVGLALPTVAGHGKSAVRAADLEHPARAESTRLFNVTRHQHDRAAGDRSVKSDCSPYPYFFSLAR